MNFVTAFLFIFLSFTIFFPTSLFSFEDFELEKVIKEWEKENSNQAIVLITSPSSGKIEFASNIKKVFEKKLPAGSILKTLSSFVFLSHTKKFQFSTDKKYLCNGKFKEPKNGFFTDLDKENYSLFEDEKTKEFYFRCSVGDGHGEVNFKKALALSCNAYYLHFASLNPVFFYNFLVKSWDLKEGTKFSLEPSHSISDKGLRTPFAFTLTSIGDSGKIKLTALKIAQIYGAILEGTPILKPIQKGENPEEIKPFPFSEESRGKIKKALELTVKEGTLKELILKNTSIQILGGKTGTPTSEGEKFITSGWNIIYFKKRNDPYLLVVFVEKGSGKREALELSTIILNLL